MRVSALQILVPYRADDAACNKDGKKTEYVIVFIFAARIVHLDNKLSLFQINTLSGQSRECESNQFDCEVRVLFAVGIRNRVETHQAVNNNTVHVQPGADEAVKFCRRKDSTPGPSEFCLRSVWGVCSVACLRDRATEQIWSRCWTENKPSHGFGPKP
jgi:hypothetical protein